MSAPSSDGQRVLHPGWAVHQFVPALIPRDATGNHTLLLASALRAAGVRSEIFAEATHDDLAGQALDIADYPDRAAPGDVLVYQFSTSSMVADFLAARPEPLVLDYHNVTAPQHFEAWDPEAARRSAQAVDQLARLAPKAVLGMCDSAFNARDLAAAGCRRVEVVPVLADIERVRAAPDPRVAAHLASLASGGGADWLFVGRVVPSKAQHDLVKALWAYRRMYDPAARLHLVGATPSRRYLGAVRGYAAALGLADAVHVAGEVSDSALAAYFAAADGYLSLSLHEGFGVPLLEALLAGLPVVARAAGAVGETLGDGGLLVDRAEPALVAAAMARVLGDADLAACLAAAGRTRLEALSSAGAARTAVDLLTSVGAPR